MSNVYNEETKAYEPKRVFSAKFTVVCDGSPENKAFFASTPMGFIEIGTYREDFFQEGKTYYTDFTPVEE
jgi:hypothetical protein